MCRQGLSKADHDKMMKVFRLNQAEDERVEREHQADLKARGITQAEHEEMRRKGRQHRIEDNRKLIEWNKRFLKSRGIRY